MYYGKIPDRRRRFISFVGDGFVVGLVSSSAFHFLSGLRGSPRGGRLAGGAQAVRAKAPAFACWLGAYAAVFFSLETAMSIARPREDSWNSIAAGAASSCLLEMRRGARAAALSALIGAAVVVVPLSFVSEWDVSRPVQMYLDSQSTKPPRSTASSNINRKGAAFIPFR
ncbi:unnamed protein product [Urochloa humidicola]